MSGHDRLEVHLAAPHEGRCNYCDSQMPVWVVTSTRPEGGLIVRFCVDCLDELFRKTKGKR